ncbi:hypothetical protein [Sphingobium subterraneum]|uniref:Uncharacterized protein n=1 Tax=Sphingobium subterraneum TaxID=627688 RepID=A0A841J2C5_9SPHN|nr:hypothetical protein [Sphingobium subterraneum]MBB6124967.1 hypothetical protein [Sphingobium subterraneum]
MNHIEHCKAQAEKARTDAQSTSLDNVRDRCLRSMAVWLDMADRAERIAEERAHREAGKVPFM